MEGNWGKPALSPGTDSIYIIPAGPLLVLFNDLISFTLCGAGRGEETTGSWLYPPACSALSCWLQGFHETVLLPTVSPAVFPKQLPASHVRASEDPQEVGQGPNRPLPAGGWGARGSHGTPFWAHRSQGLPIPLPGGLAACVQLE